MPPETSPVTWEIGLLRILEPDVMLLVAMSYSVPDHGRMDLGRDLGGPACPPSVMLA